MYQVIVEKITYKPLKRGKKRLIENVFVTSCNYTDLTEKVLSLKKIYRDWYYNVVFEKIT